MWRLLARIGKRRTSRASAIDRNLGCEFDHYVEQRADEFVKKGLSPADAQSAARRAFGDDRRITRHCRLIAHAEIRRRRRREILSGLQTDICLALRSLRREPLFAVLAVASVALGIAVTSTVFSVINAVVLRPLPFEHEERLVILWDRHRDGGERLPTIAAFNAWRETSMGLEGAGMADRWASTESIATDDGAVRLRIQRVSPQLFELLGARPTLGRAFSADGTQQDRATAVISHEHWQRRFGGDENALGSRIAAEAVGSVARATVIGVMPSEFWVFPWASDVDVWLPAEIPAEGNDVRWGVPVGKLREGVSTKQAQSELDQIVATVDPTGRLAAAGWHHTAEPFRRSVSAGYAATLGLLLGAGGFVLLIGCANTAMLLLSRGARKSKEMATRIALGAGRGRLIVQLLTESVVLALLGGSVGIALVFVGIDVFVASASGFIPAGVEIVVDRTVVGFTTAISVLVGVLFGLAPALRLSRPVGVIKTGAGGKRVARLPLGRVKVGSTFAISEIALAMVLLVGAGLMLQSLVRLLYVDTGFRTASLLTVELTLRGPRYVHSEDAFRGTVVTELGALFFRELEEQARALPGVEAAGVASWLPGSWIFRRPISIVGDTSESGERWTSYTEASAGFFETLEIPLIRGRYMDDTDLQGSAPVAVVNSTFARIFFEDGEPLGRVLVMSLGPGVEDVPRQIVGVVGDTRQNLREEPWPVVYVPVQQYAGLYPATPNATAVPIDNHLHKGLVLRASASPIDLYPQVLAILESLDRDQLPDNAATMETRMARGASDEMLWVRLLGMLAGMAAFLAAAGIYGVVSYSVAQQTHQIGVRVALGARRSDILRFVGRQGLSLGVTGISLGVLLALGMGRLLESRLFAVSPADPMTLAGVSLVLGAIVAAAICLPARRAAKVDPVVALRGQ